MHMLRVLIVDDEPLARENLRVLLQETQRIFPTWWANVQMPLKLLEPPFTTVPPDVLVSRHPDAANQCASKWLNA
jgi:DNA-binding NarL/FixJ family response regulator